MRRAFTLAVIALTITGCATPRPFLAPIIKEAGPSSLGHYVGSRLGKRGPVIETGSAARGEALFDPAAAEDCRHRAAARTATVTLCAQDPIDEPMLDAWLTDFSAALDALNRRVFADTPLILLDLTVYAAGPSARIDFVRRMPFDGRTASLAFVTRTTLLRESLRRVPSQTFAHESYHAVLRARRLIDGIKPRKAPVTEIVLEESAAEFYGLCASLLATNVAVRAEANHDYRGRPGGVFLDAELRALIGGDFEARKPALSRYEVKVIADMVATTLWSDAIGPRYIAEGDRAEGQAILALCSKENLSTRGGFRALLARAAEDGKDAAPLPTFEGDTRTAYFARYRDAIARRRADQAARDRLKAQDR